MMSVEVSYYRIGDLSLALHGMALAMDLSECYPMRPFAVDPTERPDGMINSVGNWEFRSEVERFSYPLGNGIDRCHLYENGVGDPLYQFDTGSSLLHDAHGTGEARLFYFHEDSELLYLLWLAYAHLGLPHGALPVHASAVVRGGEAVLFLGESGTGKSTHSRLWLEHIEGTELLNDDSPILRLRDGAVWAYGSPWSGKTPCYRPEAYPVRAIVRLRQASANSIELLPTLQAVAAVQPSCPPTLMKVGSCVDPLIDFVGRVVECVPIYRLSCLPDREAAELCCRTVMP